MAVAGFVVGLVGLLLFWIPYLGAVIALVGLVLAIVGFRQANERQAPKGLAIAGLVCAIIGVLLGLLWSIAFTDAVDEIDEELDSITFTTTTF